MAPSPRLLGLMAAGLLVAALPVLVHPGLWTLVLGCWLAAALAAGGDVLVLRLARPSVTAEAPPSVGVGDACALRVRVGLPGRRGLTATLRAEARLPLEAGEDLRVRLPAGESEHVLRLPAPRRGRGGLDAVWLRLDGPLGLVQRLERLEADAGEVAVVENLRRVQGLALEHFGAARYPGGMRQERQRGDGSEFDALEAYVPGMDPRHVDWKATARHHALRVRRYRLERNQRMVVCLDTGRLMADPIADLVRLDHGVHAALLVAWSALRAGDLVGLHAYGSRPAAWLPPASGVRHLRRLTRACSELRAEDEETNHVLGLHDLLTRLHRRSLIVVFTEFTDATTAELMVETLGRIVRRHLVVFVALDDPLTAAPLSMRPTTPDHLAEAIVAGGLVGDRQRVLRRLERAGVDVVHGPPGRAALDLLAAWTRIKRRELIG